MNKQDFEKLSQLDRIEYRLEEQENRISLITPSFIWAIVSILVLVMVADIFLRNFGVENFFIDISDSLFISFSLLFKIGIILDIFFIIYGLIKHIKMNQKYKQRSRK